MKAKPAETLTPMEARIYAAAFGAASLKHGDCIEAASAAKNAVLAFRTAVASGLQSFLLQEASRS